MSFLVTVSHLYLITSSHLSMLTSASLHTTYLHSCTYSSISSYLRLILVLLFSLRHLHIFKASSNISLSVSHFAILLFALGPSVVSGARLRVKSSTTTAASKIANIQYSFQGLKKCNWLSVPLFSPVLVREPAPARNDPFTFSGVVKR